MKWQREMGVGTEPSQCRPRICGRRVRDRMGIYVPGLALALVPQLFLGVYHSAISKMFLLSTFFRGQIGRQAGRSEVNTETIEIELGS